MNNNETKTTATDYTVTAEDGQTVSLQRGKGKDWTGAFAVIVKWADDDEAGVYSRHSSEKAARNAARSLAKVEHADYAKFARIS